MRRVSRDGRSWYQQWHRDFAAKSIYTAAQTSETPHVGIAEDVDAAAPSVPIQHLSSAWGERSGSTSQMGRR